MQITRGKIAAVAAAPLVAIGVLGTSAFAASPSPTTPTPATTTVANPAATNAGHSGVDQPEKAASENPQGGAAETDGPGGHADPAGNNVDHQFNGVE